MKMSERSRPKFITFEGGEGAGKTSLIDSIEGLLGKMNISAVRTREPGGSVLGYQIRKWLLDKTDAQVGNKAELLLFLAARAQHIEEVIAPNIMRGNIVLCDRFNDSTVAYQGAARGLGIKWVQSLCDMVCGDVLPDLTFYLDVDPQTGLKRTKKASKENASTGKLDRIEAEQLVFHERVREAFISIGNANPDRFVFIDANRPKEVVFDAAKKVIQECFTI
jgi:dTMP kinase